ncbi:hypothetical protein SG34_000030 [Thalassomonas viridans]|uniref:Uncharacterized protein n=1 Tax=Thalassomonas viridans TaxID=137584 RepID=A0AAE9Z221_9GAMM|nr:hypothetical protein [Thalassomonas viridans]WDE05376.1 hypothetical protein SG34_000030 [Thalassomonas viridans]
MSDLKQELAAVRAELKKHPLDEFKNDILELINLHGASQQEVVIWLEVYKDISITQSTLSRRLSRWKAQEL